MYCPTYVKKKQKPFMDQDEEVGKLLCSSKKVFKLKTACIKMCTESVIMNLLVATSTDTVQLEAFKGSKFLPIQIFCGFNLADPKYFVCRAYEQ